MADVVDRATEQEYVLRQEALARIRARRSLPQELSRSICEECGEVIPQARRDAIPGVRLCVICQQESER